MWVYVSTGKFRSGRAKVLVATDVASRGLDIHLVISLNHPNEPNIHL